MHKDGRAYWARTIKALNAHQQHSTFVQLETLLYISQQYLPMMHYLQNGVAGTSVRIPVKEFIYIYIIYIYTMYYIRSIDQPGLSTPFAISCTHRQA